MRACVWRWNKNHPRGGGGWSLRVDKGVVADAGRAVGTIVDDDGGADLDVLAKPGGEFVGEADATVGFLGAEGLAGDELAVGLVE